MLAFKLLIIRKLHKLHISSIEQNVIIVKRSCKGLNNLHNLHETMIYWHYHSPEKGDCMPRRKENLDEEIAKYYYSAKEAQKKLGMNRDRFNYILRTRHIERVPFLGGYGYYKKSDIDKLADEIDTFLQLGEKVHLQYRHATLDDLDAEIDLAALNFGRKRAEATRGARRRYLETNPEITHYLYSNERMVAAINLIPLSHEAILEFREGQRGWFFSTDQIGQFEPDRRLECIIIDMMTTTKVTLDQRHRYASYLLRDLGQITLIEWAKRGVGIMTVDACAGTEDGERILRRAGFEFLGKRDERDIYHLDIDKSDLPFIKAYKEALTEWKHHHDQ